MKCLFAAALFLAVSLPAQALTMEEAGREQKSQATAPSGQAPVAGTQECGDDERLLNIEEWLGKGPQKPLVTITPSTFIQLDQEIRSKIGVGQMLICPKIPVAKGGRPIKKVAVPFRDIMTAIESAAAADDVAGIKELLKSYTAAPLPSEEVVPMATTEFPWSKELTEKILGALGLTYIRESGGMSYTRLIQIFVQFGGMSTSKAKVLCMREDVETELPKMPKGTLGVNFRNVPESCRVLARTGLDVITK